MYENTLEMPGRTARHETGELRMIAWPELVARLAAQRDVRNVLLARNGMGCASFNPCAATMLARGQGGKPDVNPDVLGHGKQAGANTADAACGAAEGDREIA